MFGIVVWVILGEHVREEGGEGGLLIGDKVFFGGLISVSSALS